MSRQRSEASGFGYIFGPWFSTGTSSTRDFGHPKARVITLNRRSKIRLVALRSHPDGVRTARSAVCAIFRAATRRYFSNWRCGGIKCHRCGKVKQERLDFLADNPFYAKRFASMSKLYASLGREEEFAHSPQQLSICRSLFDWRQMRMRRKWRFCSISSMSSAIWAKPWMRFARASMASSRAASGATSRVRKFARCCRARRT